mmetsp:Transcript_24457/g.43528  ORF Transcript_24457/g.43528 Transcript_24457/m.43528 type:complete len:202 (-) Transcript_24457:240-845(-)
MAPPPLERLLADRSPRCGLPLLLVRWGRRAEKRVCPAVARLSGPAIRCRNDCFPLGWKPTALPLGELEPPPSAFGGGGSKSPGGNWNSAGGPRSQATFLWPVRLVSGEVRHGFLKALSLADVLSQLLSLFRGGEGDRPLQLAPACARRGSRSPRIKLPDLVRLHVSQNGPAASCRPRAHRGWLTVVKAGERPEMLPAVTVK